MFDNPKKDLKWLEQQLLKEEAPRTEAPAEDWLAEEEDWLEEQLQEARVLMGESTARQSGTEDLFRFLEEEFPEEAEPESVPSGGRRQKEKKRRKEKGIGGLVFLAWLEILGILAILLWWVFWLL